jgi:hypothetical protein
MGASPERHWWGKVFAWRMGGYFVPEGQHVALTMTSTVPPRDVGLSVSLPRHFVPGYYHAVPPGQNISTILIATLLYQSRLDTLTRWPGHWTSSKQMDVQMGYCLAAVASTVDDHPISRLRYSERLRSFLSFHQQLS